MFVLLCTLQIPKTIIASVFFEDSSASFCESEFVTNKTNILTPRRKRFKSVDQEDLRVVNGFST